MKYIKLTNLEIFYASLFSATLPGVLLFSSITFTGYYSFGVIFVPLVLSSYVILNNKNYDNKIFKLSLVFLGFSINVSYLAIPIIFGLIIIYLFNLILNKETLIFQNYKYKKKIFGLISTFLLFFSIYFFLIRAILFFFSKLYLAEEHNYFYHNLSDISFIFVCAAASLLTHYFF